MSITDEAKRRYAAQARERKEKLIAAGLCPRCGNPALPGKKRCAEHLEAHRRSYRDCRATGKCARCPAQALPGKRACAVCLEKNSTEQGQRAERYRAAGLCTGCGKAPPNATVLCDGCWFKGIARGSLGSARRVGDIRALWDAQGGRCALTGDVLTPGVNASIDHKVPRSQGGGDGIANLQWTTIAVNLAKNVLSELEFVALCGRVVSHRGCVVR